MISRDPRTKVHQIWGIRLASNGQSPIRSQILSRSAKRRSRKALRNVFTKVNDNLRIPCDENNNKKINSYDNNNAHCMFLCLSLTASA